MSTPRVDTYALQNDISNSEAKRRLRRNRKRGEKIGDDMHRALPPRGAPVAGTGKPKGE